jgi:hypothetical protein
VGVKNHSQVLNACTCMRKLLVLAYLCRNCAMRVAGWISASSPFSSPPRLLPCDPPHHPPSSRSLSSLLLPHTTTTLSSALPRLPKKGSAPKGGGGRRTHGDRPHTGFGAARRWLQRRPGAAAAREMSSRSGSVGGGSSAGGSSAGGGAAVPLAVLLRREVASERTASERPELHTGLFSQAKKGEDFTFLKPDCERVPGVPSSSFSAFGVSAPVPAPLSLSRSLPHSPIWRHADRRPGCASTRGGGECVIGLGVRANVVIGFSCGRKS